MNVRQLIDALSQLPADHEVVVDQHSEYQHIRAPELIQTFDNHSYVSRPYLAVDSNRIHGYVFIGPVAD